MRNLAQKTFVAGHGGMVGSTICRRLAALGYSNIVTADRQNLDLKDQGAVRNFFNRQRFDQVYLAAAKVGGILSNSSYPADFLYDNLMIASNVIEACHSSEVENLLFLASSAIYPVGALQPLKEEYLLTGQFDPTHEPYSIAKVAGIKLCENYNRQYGRDYRCAVPTNLYGPGDNFHPRKSHVIPALLRRIHEAKISRSSQVQIWGSGNPRREFLHVDDLADACIHIMEIEKERYNACTEQSLPCLNVGCGSDCSIGELAEIIAGVVGFKGDLVFDTTKPDGVPRKLLDVSRLESLEWKAGIALEEGLKDTYAWFAKNWAAVRFQ